MKKIFATVTTIENTEITYRIRQTWANSPVVLDSGKFDSAEDARAMIDSVGYEPTDDLLEVISVTTKTTATKTTQIIPK